MQWKLEKQHLKLITHQKFACHYSYLLSRLQYFYFSMLQFNLEIYSKQHLICKKNLFPVITCYQKCRCSFIFIVNNINGFGQNYWFTEFELFEIRRFTFLSLTIECNYIHIQSVSNYNNNAQTWLWAGIL